MSQQSDPLIIVLHIMDAINFHRPKNTPIVLSASLDRNVLETGSRLPGIASTSFDSNLVWETDRRSVKRMKMENLPIRLECYTVNQTNSEQLRSLVGYVLLPLRSIPLLPTAKAHTLKPRWHRVIGLHSQEWKNQKPEIQLTVMITDKSFLLAGKKESEMQDSKKEADQSVVIFTNPEPSGLGMDEGLPVRLLEDRGLLQVGSYEHECDIFLVKIVLKYAKRMERLLSVGDDVSSDVEFQMRYDLLGDTYPCMLERKPNGVYLIQEKIVINFRTSLHSLRKYFEKGFLIRLQVLYRDKLVGRVRLRFGELIQEGSLSDFLSKYKEISDTMDVEKYYQIEQTSDKYEENDIPDAVSDHSSSLVPAIKCKFTLKYLSTDPKHISDSTSKATKSLPESERSEEKHALALEAPELPSINLNETRSIHPPSTIQPEKTDIETILHCEDRDLRDIPRTFSYNLLVQSIRFNIRPSVGMWQFCLHHPRADTPLTKVTLELNTVESETLEFPSLQLKLYFSSMPDIVLETITAESSKLTVHGPHGLFGFARLDNQSLVVGTKEKQAGVAILENQNSESIGMATIFCFLDEVGINYNSRDPVGESLVVTATPRAQLDDQISYRILEEQKQWMIKQREMFIAELKRKESAHLMRLSSEWKKRRAKENAELTEKMEHVTALTRALEETRKSLTLKDTHMVEQNQAVEEMKTKLELSYQQKLSDIREKAARLEEDLNHRSKLQTLRCDELERKNDSLTRENDQLKQANERLTNELAVARMENENCVSLRYQLDTLGKRLNEMEQSKLFYKQQWAKMVRELNKMKLENVEQLNDALRGEERRKRSFNWDDEPSACCFQTSEADEELNKIHRLIFEEQRRQKHQCCSNDHCC